jgi:cell division protein FtsB
MRSSSSLISLACKAIKLIMTIPLAITILFLFVPQAQEMAQRQSKRDEMLAKIRQEQQIQIDLQQEIELIQRSPHYLERIARDRLNLAKPGEVIFRFDPYPSSNPPQR